MPRKETSRGLKYKPINHNRMIELELKEINKNMQERLTGARIDSIMQEVSTKLEIPIENIIGTNRAEANVNARMIAIYKIFMMYKGNNRLTLYNIRKNFKGTGKGGILHHTTILHAIRYIANTSYRNNPKLYHKMLICGINV